MAGIQQSWSQLYINGASLKIESGTSVYIHDMGMTNKTGGSDGSITNDGDLYVDGDWNNEVTGAGVVFDTRDASGTVHFVGSAAQALGSASGKSTTFESLTINNANDVTLDENIAMEQVLTLTAGDIIIGNYDLDLNLTATCPGGGALGSYVQADGNGHMTKIFNAGNPDFGYPVGDNDDYSPITVNFNSAGTWGTIEINVNDVAHPNMNTSGTSYLTRWWEINGPGFVTPDYNWDGEYTDADIVGTESEIYAAIWDGFSWSAGKIAEAESANTASSDYNSSFSGLSGGSGEALPIELLSFDAELNGDQVDLTWTTATETNNEYFTIEKTKDFENYEIVTTVPGAGNSNSMQNYSAIDYDPCEGISYYRLKQTDFDGKYEYSDHVSVEYVKTIDSYARNPVFNIYPNPAQDGTSIFISIKEFEEDSEVLIVVHNILGEMLYSKVVITDSQGYAIEAIDLHNRLSPGMYVIVGTSKDQYYSKKLIIK